MDQKNETRSDMPPPVSGGANKRSPIYIRSLRCLRCGRTHAIAAPPPQRLRFVCDCRPNVGSDMGTLDVEYDYAALRAHVNPAHIASDVDRSIGRYAALLPIATRAHLPPAAVGDTPLLYARHLGDALGLTSLYLKDDGRNPSGSLKDRASAIAVALSQEWEMSVVATASTGNAAAALAGQCAAAAQANVIFVPHNAPVAKIAQLLVYGSTVLPVHGTYDDAFDLCTAACREFGWLNRNTGYNPFMTEGKKTVAFEIAEQLARAARSTASRVDAATPHFIAPDAVFVSVGDGCIIGGVHKGFKELRALGWIDTMPRLYGVQSTGSDALYRAWRNDWDVPEPVQAQTRADSISVNAPRDPIKALAAVRETAGAFIALPDATILDALLPLARLGGVFAEPAGAAALAGLQHAVANNLVQPDETVIVINTGNGLKDVDAALQAVRTPTAIEPTLDAVQEALGNLPG